VFIGLVLTFFPQFLLGNAGMPRRYYSYPERYQWLNVLSSGGAWLLAGSLSLTLANLLVALRWGERASGNPWASRSYEWMTPPLPPKHNFDETPFIGRGPYDYHLPEDQAHA
jgi:cytochrome c oxidase subunit 1